VGYILGALVDVQQLRGYGFILTATVNILLLEQIFLPVQHASNFLLA
jgi:hypothetical protein